MMRVSRRPSVLRKIEEIGRSAPAVVATPLAGGPAGPEGKEGKEGKVGPEGAKGATGAAGPTSGGLILVRAATTAALAANTAPTITTLEASAVGALASQDGVALAVGDRLLVKNEATGSHNGVYEVTSLGSGSAKWKLTRISSMDESSEVVGGMQFNVLQGTQNAGVTFRLLTTGAIVLGTTALTFGSASAWVEPVLSNSWTNLESSWAKAQYRKASDGRIQLHGVVVHATSLAANSVIFTLPEGFRPSKQLMFAVFGQVGSNPGVIRVDITTVGEVLYTMVTAATVPFLGLDPISFYAD